MSTIGFFNATKDNGFAGNLALLAFQGRVEMRRTKEGVLDGDKPTHRIYQAGTMIELGAAWMKTAEKSGNIYHSVKLSAPGLPVTYGNLIEQPDEDGYVLIWSTGRSQGAEAAAAMAA